MPEQSEQHPQAAKELVPIAAPESYPLRVTATLAAQLLEWRTGDTLPRATSVGWQLVYVRSGIIEETCENRRVTLHPGALLLHQPEERYAMRAVSELPPEVLRVEFYCTGTVMDALRGRWFHAEPVEQLSLGWICSMVPVVFAPPTAPGLPPARKPDPPFAANQQLAIYLENLLILLLRRSGRQRKLSTRLRRERAQNTIVESARLYFAEHIEENLSVQQLCDATGYSKYQVSEAFSARLHHGPLEEFSNMKLSYAAQLLARGATPGEVTRRLGYCSGAYFSKRFHETMGLTPSAYRRLQQGLPAKRAKPPPPKKPAAANAQQKSRQDTETSIPETAQNS